MNFLLPAMNDGRSWILKGLLCSLDQG